MNESLTNRQIAFIIFGITVGYGIMRLPKNIAQTAGTGGWITLLIATAIASISTYIIIYLGYIHNDKTICEYSELLTGKFISKLIISIYGIEFFLFFTMAIRASSEVIKHTVLIKTPIWALELLYYVVVYYAVANGLRIIARINEIYGIIIITGILVLTFILFTQGKLINLRPYFGSSDITTYLKASLVTVIPFGGMEILTIIPFNRRKNNKNVFKYAVSMVVLIGFIYILIVESSISIMGVDSIIQYDDALLATVRRIDVRTLQFLRRLDGLLLAVWIMAVFCTVVLHMYGAVFLISKSLKKINYHTTEFVVVILSFVISQIPQTFNQILKILEYFGYLTVVTILVIPSTLLMITKVRRYG